MLTSEQIQNWRKVLVNMGMMKFIIDNLTDAEVQKIRDNMQKMFSMESPEQYRDEYKNPQSNTLQSENEDKPKEDKPKFVNKIRIV